MNQQMLNKMAELIEHDKDVKRARAYLALELGHKKARELEAKRHA